MKKNKILDMVEKDFLTLVNLERSVHFALHSNKGRQYQLKVCHAAFKRTCDIMLKRRKEIAKTLGLKLKIIGNPSEKQEICDLNKIINSTDNQKHRLILRLLYELKLKPKQIVNLKIKDIKNNRIYCKDKHIEIPESLMHNFYIFTKDKDPDDYFVESNRKKKYSTGSIQEVRKKFLKIL